MYIIMYSRSVQIVALYEKWIQKDVEIDGPAQIYTKNDTGFRQVPLYGECPYLDTAGTQSRSFEFSSDDIILW